MVRGIAIMGLNGCGKSTLAHAIAKKLGFYEMDVEDYYFPEQKNSRQAILEQKYDVRCEYKGELPYSMPCSAKEVQEMIITIDKQTMLPLCVRMRQGSNRWIRISIFQYKSHMKFSDDMFTFHHKDFPQATVIDIR